MTPYINSFAHGQNGRHFADDVFKRIFLSEYIWTNFQQNFIEICFLGSYWQCASNADPFQRSVYAALGVGWGVGVGGELKQMN